MVAVCSHARRHQPQPGLPTRPTERYEPRRPYKTPLYRIVAKHLETWLTARDRADEPVPGHVQEEFRAYLECGILCFGFARARCTACGHGFLIGFSCKGHGVCPSCNSRRMAQTAADMLAWENNGFSIDASVRITLTDRDVPGYFKSVEHLVRYCARPAFALERLSLTESRHGGTGIGQPEAGMAVEPYLGFGSDRPGWRGPWMALPP